jgi:hypothetical protein
MLEEHIINREVKVSTPSLGRGITMGLRHLRVERMGDGKILLSLKAMEEEEAAVEKQSVILSRITEGTGLGPE